MCVIRLNYWNVLCEETRLSVLTLKQESILYLQCLFVNWLWGVILKTLVFTPKIWLCCWWIQVWWSLIDL